MFTTFSTKFLAASAAIAVGVYLTSIIQLVSARSPSKFGIEAEKNAIFIGGKFFRRGYRNTNGERVKEGLENPKEFVKPQASDGSESFDQCLDHETSGGCSTTWAQRYWQSWDYYVAGGPIFFMINEESSADGVIDYGTWLHYAKNYNALCVVLEHRFYGKSIPTTNTSASAMRLLTSRQALGDAANFIKWYKQSQGLDDAKVVAFGGSYGGNLVAWFRQKHPDAVNLGVSSSGPLEAKFDFHEYMGVVADVIWEMDQDCYMKIFNAFWCMDDIVNGYHCTSSSYTDPSELSTAMHQCYQYDFSNKREKESFFRGFGYSWLSNYPHTENKDKCSLIRKATDTADSIDIYGEYVKASNESNECTKRSTLERRLESMEDDVLRFIRSDEDEAQNGRSWLWQTCNEFGYYQTADGELFASDLWGPDTDVRRCRRAFPDADFTEAKIRANVDAVNKYYKGRKNDGTCIIFVNGKWDPWHVQGINNRSQTSSKNYVVSIPEAEHCGDMVWPNDHPYTKSAINKINTQIGKYLQDPNCHL